MAETRIPKFVTFGNGGDVVYYSAYCRCSGYGTPDSPHAAKGEEMPDGTPVLDKRPALETEAGYSWVFRGPMLNPDLVDGDLEECPTPDPAFAEALGIGSKQWGGLLQLQSAKVDRGPLDFVSISEYMDGWRSRGARSGHYESGQIVWDN